MRILAYWESCRVITWSLGVVLGWSMVSWTIVPIAAMPPQDFDSQEVQFFEEQVRPILVEHCLQCHGNDPEHLGGNLALISRKTILDGGDSGSAFDEGDTSASLLLDAINYGSYEMPPSGQLPAKEIDILTRWVEMGLPWNPADANKTLKKSGAHAMEPEVNAETKAFWSFQAVSAQNVPEVEDTTWPQNDVDRFVLARLEEAGLKPAAPASKLTLVRRLYYDLLGLPPTPQQVLEFVSDSSPDAYAQLVDKLLASPHYGEKWGRHWLDLVRYAESNSFERDGTKPFVWRYRDYVIRAFNDDKPYDQFVREQLAGDEFAEPTTDSIIATGYYRLGQWDDEPADRKQALFDDLDDILATTGQAMMGLTINCARCHDHKIDPIPQADYYRMLALFRNVKRYGVRSHESVIEASSRQLEHADPPPEEVTQKYESKIAELEQQQRELEALVQADFEPVEHEDFKYEENRVRLLKLRIERKIITQKQWDQYRHRRQELIRMRENPPQMYRVLCVKEHHKECPPTHVLIRGNPHLPGDIVEPGFVSVLSPPDPKIVPLTNGESSGRRLALANWITSSKHPLTARVMVNRIWQHHFGRGIVRSANDFGFQGDRPTHPLLLDYLANAFVAEGWSIKAMHRKLLLSNTYRMGGGFDERANQVDPLNNLFWRFSMRRLTAEEIRDSILAVSGRLNSAKMYGPSVFTRLSKEVLSGQSMPGAGWGSSSVDDQRRRSIYIHVKRSLRVPLLANFDSADTDFSCPVRFNTTQPTQALGMLNSGFTNDEATQFARRIESQWTNPSEQVREILWRVTQRPPDDVAIAEGVKLMQAWQDADGVSQQQALSFFCLTAFNLNEFIFVE